MSHPRRTPKRPGFYATLTAAYEPEASRSTNLPSPPYSDTVEDDDRQQFCNAMVKERCALDEIWETEAWELEKSGIPVHGQRRSLYTPHGKWEEFASSPIEDCETVAFLGGL